jgi:hypothetical protein
MLRILHSLETQHIDGDKNVSIMNRPRSTPFRAPQKHFLILISVRGREQTQVRITVGKIRQITKEANDSSDSNPRPSGLLNYASANYDIACLYLSKTHLKIISIAF